MGRQNQQSVVHPFISRGRHQMTHLWHFVVQKIITTAIEVCIGLFMCPLFSLCSSICQCWCQPLPNPATAPRPMDPVICVTTGYFVSSLCHISPPPLPHFRPPFPPFNPLLIHLVTSPRPRTCKQLTQSRRKTVRLKIICSDDLWINKFHVQQSQAQIEIHLTFTWCSPDHLTIIWPSPDPHKTLTLPWLREFKLHLKFTWRSPGFPWHSPDIHLTTWPSSDLPLTLTRPLPYLD